MIQQFRRIIKDFKFNKNENKNHSIIKSRDVQNNSIWRAVASFTWRDVKEEIMKKYEIWIDINVWRQILKERLGYSFKRCSSRPFNLNVKLQELKKTLFVVKLLKMIRRSTLLINIDETVVSYKTKSNYSWSLKGSSANLSTMVMSGSINIVSAIFSNGINITGLRNDTIAAESFVEFIDHLLTICNRL